MPSSDSALLFGLIAFQHGLIDRDQLVAAFGIWCKRKSSSFESILMEQGVLSSDVCDTLRQMVELHLEHHQGDLQKSFAAIASSGVLNATKDLASLSDEDLDQSISLFETIGLPDDVSPYPKGFQGRAGQRFRILRPLPDGEGGMGVISVARDEELGREVAYKQIRDDRVDHPAYRQKFEVEAEVTGNLEHPGIVPIYGLGIGPDGRPYYAMRLVKGDNLAKAIEKFHKWRQAGELDYDSVEFRGLVDRVIDVAQAISYAHSRGVLHRDLKPGNIMLGKFGETLVIDWGLARLPQTTDQIGEAGDDPASLLKIPSGSEMEPTQHGSVMGTLGYSPPEQLVGDVASISPRSDVYALGAILYQVLTGKLPVPVKDAAGQKRNTEDITEDVLQGQVRPPREFSKRIPRPLAAICLKAFSVKPADRYSSAADLIDDIERWKADQSVRASPDTLGDLLARFVRKHRAAVVAAGGLLLGIAVVSTVAAILVNESRKAESEAGNRAIVALKFITDAFKSVRPISGGNAQTSAKDVLFKAQERLESSELDDIGKAELFLTLSFCFTAIGEYDNAVSTGERAHETTKHLFGPDHLQTLTSMHNLANAYTAAGRNDEALDLYQAVFSARTQKLGSDHHHTIAAMHNLAGSYESAGRLDEAIWLYEKALTLAQTTLGQDHPDTLVAMHNLAYTHEAAGRLDEAISLYEKTLATKKSKMGAGHPHTLETMNSLAYAYTKAGYLNKAITLGEKTVEMRKIKLGAKHPSTLMSMNNLAYAYDSASRQREALVLYEETFAGRTAKLGLDHPSTINSMLFLANIYRSAERMEEAMPLYEQTLAARTRLFGDHDARTLQAKAGLGAALMDVEDLENAEVVLRECLQLLRQHHPNVLTTFTTMSLLGEALFKQGKYGESLPLLLDGFQGIKQRAQKISPNDRQRRLKEAVQRLHEYAQLNGDADGINKWKAELDRIKSETTKTAE